MARESRKTGAVARQRTTRERNAQWDKEHEVNAYYLESGPCSAVVRSTCLKNKDGPGRFSSPLGTYIPPNPLR